MSTLLYPLVLLGMGGLGDSIYQRPFVRAHVETRDEVFFRTPWPELYADLEGVRFTYPESMRLRTQAKNIARQPAERWVQGPARAERRTFGYSFHDPGVSVVESMESKVGLEGRPFVFDLPDFGPPPVRYRRPYAVLRPVSVRAEWRNSARNPLPEYVGTSAEVLRTLGYRVVLVADVDGENEWLVGELPRADRVWIHGELHVEWLMALVQGAAVVAGGVGWIVPAAVAARTPLVVIGGGLGAYNAPSKITDPRMDLARTRFLLPDPYCRCSGMTHDCPREIPDFEARFRAALGEVTA